jgi:hypothetical protein
LFGSAPPPLATSTESVPMDPLKIGGLLYLRSEMDASLMKDQNGNKTLQPPDQYKLTMPNLLNVYMDARPNDRVRGMVVGRLNFNPTIDPNKSPGFGQPPSPQTSALLDQFWLKFDIYRRVFITAGKQHVKWGTGRFWNPTDFLQPVKLNPLAVYDERTGVTMVKAHVPYEERNWNFYAIGLLEGPNIVNAIGQVGGAGRAEFVLGPAEIGFDGLVQKGRKPRYGVDISSSLGSFDLYGEAAFRDPRGETYYRLKNDQFDPVRGLSNFETFSPDNSLTTQFVLGGNWQTGFGDNNSFTAGLEYFYNPLGANSAYLYPYEILQGAYVPFYAGQNYGGAYITLLIPTSQAFASNSFTLSTLSNLTDRSFISRLDYNIILLQHLQVEAYGSANYGHEGGEYRFGVDTTYLHAANPGVPAVVVGAPAYAVGVALRVSI